MTSLVILLVMHEKGAFDIELIFLQVMEYPSPPSEPVPPPALTPPSPPPERPKSATAASPASETRSNGGEAVVDVVVAASPPAASAETASEALTLHAVLDCPKMRSRKGLSQGVSLVVRIM